MSTITHAVRLSCICLILLLALFTPAPRAEASDTSLPTEEQPALPESPAPELIEEHEDPGEVEPTEDSEEPAAENYGEMADDFHRMVSRKLETSANWLDSFFRDERTEIEENETSMRLRLSSFLEEGEKINADARIRLRLVLPELEDKFHIFISGERDDDDINLRQEPMRKRGEIDEDAERNVNLSLRYFIKKAHDKNFSFKVGARVNDFPPVFYAGPRFRISKKFSPWLVRFTQEIKYFSDDGWESETRFDFEKPLTERLFFRISTEGSWFEHEPGYYYDMNFNLYQIIDEDRALEYAWGNYFETRPVHRLDQILWSVKYRQRLWREWLFFEIRPQIAFREEDDYEPTPGITFALEALFGNKKW